MPAHPRQNDMWQALYRHILEKSSTDESLTETLTAASRLFGSTSKQLSHRHIERCLSGQRVFSLWLRLSLLYTASRSGWAPSDAHTAETCYAVWQKGYPGVTLEQFASDFNIPPGSEILKFT